MHGSREIQHLIEKQLRNWELARSQQVPQQHEPRPAVHPFVTISRQVGAGGLTVAEGLAQRLGWPVFDQQLLHAMAGDDRVRERLYESMDERDIHWLEEVMHWMLHGRPHSPHDYVQRLCRTVLAIARGGSAIFVGRGADLILPQETGLRVRLAAPREQRVENFARRHGLDPQQARDEIERVEKERAEFVRRHFHRDANDPLRFDLVVNTGRMEAAGTVDLILAAVRLRGLIDPGAPDESPTGADRS